MRVAFESDLDVGSSTPADGRYRGRRGCAPLRRVRTKILVPPSVGPSTLPKSRRMWRRGIGERTPMHR
eukprot:scaffold7495_cov53-Phaeocystis_antarctica.AAC.3